MTLATMKCFGVESWRIFLSLLKVVVDEVLKSYIWVCHGHELEMLDSHMSGKPCVHICVSWQYYNICMFVRKTVNLLAILWSLDLCTHHWQPFLAHAIVTLCLSFFKKLKLKLDLIAKFHSTSLKFGAS